MKLRELRRLAIEARESGKRPESLEVLPMHEEITDEEIEAEERVCKEQASIDASREALYRHYGIK